MVRNRLYQVIRWCFVVVVLSLLCGLSLSQGSPLIQDFRIEGGIYGWGFFRNPQSDLPEHFGFTLRVVARANGQQTRLIIKEPTETHGVAFFVTAESSVSLDLESPHEIVDASWFVSRRIATVPLEICVQTTADANWQQTDQVCLRFLQYLQLECRLRSEGGDCPDLLEDFYPEPLPYFRPHPVEVANWQIDTRLGYRTAQNAEAQESQRRCPNAHLPTMYDYDWGRVTYTDGSPTGIRDFPQGNVIARLPEGTEFRVIDPPFPCRPEENDGLNWAYVVTREGIRGFVPYGYRDGPYWIEPVPQETGSGWSPTFPYVEVYYQHEPWGNYVFRFLVDTEHCLILNGAEVVQRHLSYFGAQTFDLSPIATLQYAVSYFYPDTQGTLAGLSWGFMGQIETFRQSLIEQLTTFNGCHEDCREDCDEIWHYLVGPKQMDTSGVGNIVFGYFMAQRPAVIENWLSDTEQGVNLQSLLVFQDNQDDVRQRELGRALGQTSTNGIAPTVEDIQNFARILDLE